MSSTVAETTSAVQDEQNYMGALDAEQDSPAMAAAKRVKAATISRWLSLK
jgi:hypothetical protein